MESHSISLLTTLLLVFLSAIVGGIVAKRLKQPMLLGYIAAGVVFGNLAPPVLTNKEFLELIADIGVVLLLFTLGVEFSFHKLRSILRTILWAASTQIVVSILVFLLVFWISGFTFLPALFLSVAASLSSTAVVVKYLTESGELETRPGLLMTGWLIIQDLAVVPLMLLLTALSTQGGGASVFDTIWVIAASMLKAAIALGLILFLGRIAIPFILRSVAKLRSREVFLLTVMGIVFLAAIGSFAVGLSAALGAFIAGLLIAETSQNHAIFAEIRPLRDLFAVIFFVSLGLTLPVALLVSRFWMLVGFASVVVIVKLFLIYFLVRYLGQHRKTAFITAIGLTQISEFGFIIAREGVNLGAVNQDTFVFLVALAFVSILINAPLISRSQKLYYTLLHRLGNLWPKLMKEKRSIEKHKDIERLTDHVIICGHGRVGKYVTRALQMSSIPFVVVDYNQSTVAQVRRAGGHVVYGDPAEIDVLEKAAVEKARLLIVAIPDLHTQEMVIAHAQTLNRDIKIVCRTHHEGDQKILKSLGVEIIVQPEFEAALSITKRVLPKLGVSEEQLRGKISRLKIEHGLG